MICAQHYVAIPATITCIPDITVKPLYVLKGLRKINDRCGNMKVEGKLFIWVMYRDQRK
jgi:hypothetical protein